jgi:5'-nucleotidase / UDP-sugar diphosphatase
MAATEHTGGAAGMMQRWREDENYTEDGPFLVLSGGDTWTGPAISSWFDGKPMVEVMNAMGYDAAALGNHEFDFGIAGLRERMAQAEFPFLGANVVPDASSGSTEPIALPYIVQDVEGWDSGATVKVGIIGLASTRTPRTTMPTHVAGLRFEEYATTLAATVPAARGDGAEVIVVISHLCSPELRTLAAVAQELDIAMLGGGHCHERFSRVDQGVALVSAGWQLGAYGRVEIALGPETRDVIDVTVELRPNPAGDADGEIAAIVDTWQARVDDELLITIGYAKSGITKSSPAMHNLVMDAWLTAYPADIAMSNPGGFRQDIAAGGITLADIVGVLPFDNVLVDAALTGRQVIAAYEHGSRRPAVGGLAHIDGTYTVDGEPLDPDTVYHVLINDFMYAGGDGYRFAEYDPDAYQTGIDWRQPAIEWISALNTTEADPLGNYLDGARR